MTYNRTNTCDKIKEDGTLCRREFFGDAYREKNKNGDWTGNWICVNCYKKEFNKRADSFNGICKSLRDRRTNNIKSWTSNYKGDKFQDLTCLWRSIDDLNEKNDNYKSPVDHSRDTILGIVQTKGKFYNSYNQCWTTHLGSEQNAIRKGIEFDNLIFYCASKDGKFIERLYIIPKKEIIKRISIYITKNPKDRWGNPIIPWYEQYRINEEKELKIVNEIWRKIWM